MRIHVSETTEQAAARAAEWLRTEISRAVAQRERCLIALSGGRTPWRMLHELRQLRVHWHGVELYQVDERVVPANDERRNARQIADLMVAPEALTAAQFHPMPVEREPVAAGADDGAIPSEKDSWKRSNREMRVVFGSEDAREGPTAFAEKRAPVWKAR